MQKLSVSRKKILVVDPDSGPHDPVVNLLIAENYKVSLADSADRAWEALRLDHPDLVLLETMLPTGTEGFHLVWRLRDDPDERLSQTPVLIVSRIHQTTALNLFPDFHDGHYRAHEFLPVQGFLDKPVDHERLRLAVSEVFARREPVARGC